MQTIAVARNATEAVECAKSLAIDRTQRPLAVCSNENPDEALWAAYRRADKTVITEELLRRYLHQRRNNWQHMRGTCHG